MDEATPTQYGLKRIIIMNLNRIITDYYLAESIQAYGVNKLADMKEECLNAERTLKTLYNLD
jgi:hypothetical protein|tara:strand:+ start:136 stop:321 length:186 start_codon:yes stop_codon:yes gene_type:complete